jgi:hypothetical protein
MIFSATADARIGGKGSRLTAQDVAHLRNQASQQRFKFSNSGADMRPQSRGAICPSFA